MLQALHDTLPLCLFLAYSFVMGSPPPGWNNMPGMTTNCRPSADYSCSLIWVCPVCSGLFIPIFRTFTVYYISQYLFNFLWFLYCHMFPELFTDLPSRSCKGYKKVKLWKQRTPHITANKRERKIKKFLFYFIYQLQLQLHINSLLLSHVSRQYPLHLDKILSNVETLMLL